MNNIIDIREKYVIDNCMAWLEESVESTDIDMTQKIVECGHDIMLELNVLRFEEHSYREDIANDLELYIDPEYDCYGHAGQIEIYVLKNGEAVDSLTAEPFADESLRLGIRDLYRTWRR